MKKGWLFLALSLVFLMIVSGCANKYLTSGKIAMRSKNWDKAIHDFKLALEDDSTNAEAHRLLAMVYKEKGEYALMLDHLDKADKLEPQGMEKTEAIRQEIWLPLFNSGRDKAKAGNYEKARDDFELAIAVQPQRYEAYVNLGYVWQHLDQSDSAYYYYEKAYELASDNITVQENFAALCFNMENYEKADSLYAEILITDPSHIEALSRRAYIADQKGEPEKAIGFYNKVLELVPDDCGLLFNLGVVYFQDEKQMEKAQEIFQRVVEICPGDINAHINLYICLIRQNKLDLAIEKLKAFTSEYPQECTGWDLLSQALLRKGDKKEALTANKKYEECVK